MPESVPFDLVAKTWTRDLQPPTAIPPAADVVIIGGGIVGVSTAWFLAKQGIDVVVCEKGHVAGEQSGRNWGWVRQQGRDAREMPMIVESLRIWRHLGDEIGEDLGYRQHGILYLINDDKQLERYAAWAKFAENYETGTRLIDRNELPRFVRRAAVEWRGALHTPTDGRAEPHRAAPALAYSATKYLNGRCDVVAGAVVTAREDDLWERIGQVRLHGGAIVGSFEAWLLQRGMRTLFLRVQKASESALAIARHFEGHPN